MVCGCELMVFVLLGQALVLSDESGSGLWMAELTLPVGGDKVRAPPLLLCYSQALS